MIIFKPKKSIFLLVLTLFLLFFVFSFCEAATLYLMPQSQNIYQEDSLIIDLRIDTESEEINTAEVNLNFSSDLFEIVEFNKGDSIFTFWPEEPESKDNIISFMGGVPGGFQGTGSLLKINLRAKETGQTIIFFKNNSRVLLNDGKGTLAELSLSQGNYKVSKKPEGLIVISSRNCPDQNKWYSSTTLHIQWDLIEGAEYSYVLSRDPLAEPDETADSPEGELMWMGDMEYDLKTEGDWVYYFTLRQRLLGEDWSKEISRFRAMIDSTPPEDFKPEIGQESSVFEGKYFLNFTAQDKTSGIDHYEVTELTKTFWVFTSKEQWETVKSPYLLKDQRLKSKILVKAVDKAGNNRIAQILPAYKIGWEDVAFLVILFLIIRGVIWWLRKKIQRKKYNQ